MSDYDRDDWTPEFRRQRPPFQPGNQAALKTGVFSPRIVDPLVTELVDQVLANPDTAYLRAPHWRAALHAWARAEVEVQLLTAYIAKAGERSKDGVGDLDVESVNRAYLLKHRAETRATTQRTRLGLDPLSAARLGRDRAATQVDVAKTMAELDRRDRERQQRQRDEESGEDGDD